MEIDIIFTFAKKDNCINLNNLNDNYICDILDDNNLPEISSINNIRGSRIRNEIRKLCENHDSILLPCNILTSENVFVGVYFWGRSDNMKFISWNIDNQRSLILIGFENTNVKIKLDSMYPFSGFKSVEINSPKNNTWYNYHFILKTSSILLKNLGFKNTKCLCCESLLCKNNWAPTKTLKDLFNEIQTNLSYKRKRIEIIIINVIKRKYLCSDIPILDFL